MALFAHIVSTEHSGSNAFGSAEDYLKELISQVEVSKEDELVMILADDFSMTSLVPFYHACTNKGKFDDKIKPVFGLKLTIQADNSVEFLLEEGAFYVDVKGNLIVNKDETYEIILDDCSVTLDEENNTSVVMKGKKTIIDETNRITDDGKALVSKFESYEIKKPVFDKDHSIIVVAKDEEGRKNLNRLVSAGYKIELDSKYKKINWNELTKHSEGLMLLSGGKQGAIESAIASDKMELAKKRFELFNEVFSSEDIYLQVQRVENTVDGQAREEKIIDGLKALSEDKNAQLFATNDVRFPKKENYKDFIIRKKAMDKKEMYDPSDIIEISEEQYLKPTAEMIRLFSDLPDALVNTVKMTKKTELKDYRLKLYQSYLPEFPIPEAFDNLDGISQTILDMEEGEKKNKEIVDFKSSKYLRHLSYQGLEDRWPLILKNQNLIIGNKTKKGELIDEEFIAKLKKTYQDQIDMELEVIHRTGFPGYFLIVQDVIGWCKANDIPVGPGRGSGAGSIVLYCLLITDIDSIQYELLFERFLNPERVGEPDIDIDFSPRQRQRVIKYVADTYGIENTGQILTHGTMAAKDVVDNIGRVLGLLPEERNRIKDLISGDPGTKLKDELDVETGNEKLLELRKSSPQVDMMLTSALELEGSTKSYGRHAGGVVISYGDMAQYAGLYQEAKDQGVTENKELQKRLESQGLETLVPTVQVDKNLCETVGLIKFDFLGLKNLDIIDDCIKFLNRNEPSLKDFRASDISPHDEKALDLFRVADTYGIFQFESPAMRRLMRKMIPDTYDEVIALVALFRPGPLQSGMADDFVDRKHGRAKVEYPHRDLSTLLKATYGTIIYQEQVMSISRILSGFTRGEADTLRKAMGKKNFDLMKKMRQLFAEGAGHHYCEETIENTSKKYPSIVNKGQFLGLNINLEDVEHPKLKEILNSVELTEEHIAKNIDKFGYSGTFVSTKEQVIAFLTEYAELTETEVEELDIRIDSMKDVEFFKEFKGRVLEKGMPKLENDGLSKEDAELLLSRFFIGSGVFVRFNEIFSKMNEFAAYGFNASHSVAYANVSMQTAFLKAHYPSQYMSALISNDSNLDKASETARECRRMGIKILKPDINKSKLNFYALTAKKEERRIRYGLGMIRAVANKAKHIIERREKHGKINDIYEFYQLFADYKTMEIVQKEGIVKEQRSKVIDVTVLKALLNSGALDCLCPDNNTDHRAMLLATYNHIDSTFTDLRKRLKKNYNEIKKKVNAKSVSMTHEDVLNALDDDVKEKLELTIDMDKKTFLETLEKHLNPEDVTKYDTELFFNVYNTVDKLVSGNGAYHSSEDFLKALTLLSGVEYDQKLNALSLNMVIEYCKSTFTKLEKAMKELDKTINKKTAKKPEIASAKEKKQNILESDDYKIVQFLNQIIEDEINASTIEHNGDTSILDALYNITDSLKHKQMKYNSVFSLEDELKTSHGTEELEMVEHTLNEKTHYYVMPTSKEKELVPMLNTKERSEKEFNVTGMYQTTHPLMVNAMMEDLKGQDFNKVPLADILPAIESHGEGSRNNPDVKYWNNQKIAGSILSVSDFRRFNERNERMETGLTLIVDDGTGVIQVKFAAEDIFSAGREDKGIKMLLNMKDKNSDVILLEGNMRSGNYESEGAIMYAKKIGSANPDIYLPVDEADFNAVDEIEAVPASPAQINFLKTLLSKNNVDVEKLKLDYEVDDLSKLSKYHASELIGMYTGK